MIRYTSTIRAGFGFMLDHNLEAKVEEVIAHWTRPGLKRSERMRADKIAALRAAVQYMRQEAPEPAGDEVEAETASTEPEPAAGESDTLPGGGNSDERESP